MSTRAPDTLTRGWDWQAAALCRKPGADPDWWHADGQTLLAVYARDWCGRCPIRQRCLDDAMQYEGNALERNRYGIYGGLTPGARRRLWDQQKATPR
jgi:hypothetical protein